MKLAAALYGVSMERRYPGQAGRGKSMAVKVAGLCTARSNEQEVPIEPVAAD